MPRLAHHAALAAANGKIYVIGGFVPPKDTQIPTGGAWEPIADTWEYDPAADSWKSLAPLPTKRGAAVAVSYTHLPEFGELGKVTSGCDLGMAIVGIMPRRRPDFPAPLWPSPSTRQTSGTNPSEIGS